MPTRSNFSNGLYVRNNRNSKKTMATPGVVADLLTSLRSYWKFEIGTEGDDSLGINAFDYASNNQAGKIGDGVLSDSGDSDTCLAMDVTDFQLVGQSFTFAQWVKAGSGVIFGRYEEGTLAYALTVQSSRYQFRYVGTGGEVILSADSHGAPSGTWEFVVIWVDSVAETINIQVNNGTVDSVSIAGNSLTESSTFQIGGPGFDLLQGATNIGVDEMAFYMGRVLAAVDRTALYNGGAGNQYPFS